MLIYTTKEKIITYKNKNAQTSLFVFYNSFCIQINKNKFNINLSFELNLIEYTITMTYYISPPPEFKQQPYVITDIIIITSKEQLLEQTNKAVPKILKNDFEQWIHDYDINNLYKMLISYAGL